jgi:peptidoglycan/xylan/chitin deacetylase (PgdA/CDA1 family)
MTAVACFTFDNLGEAAEVGAGELAGPRAAGTDPSLAVGYPRLFELLERHGVRASFFVEGWNGVEHPEAVREIAERGHELGMHGWLHERWAGLAPHEEERLARRATDALERAAGSRPLGFRAPGGSRSSATEGVLRALGYRYDASLGGGKRPALLASGLAQVPFRWPHVDGFHYLRKPPAAPGAVRDAWLADLERAAREGGFFLLICHAFLTGVDTERLEALGAVLAAAQADPRVALRTTGEVAEALLHENVTGSQRRSPPPAR